MKLPVKEMVTANQSAEVLFYFVRDILYDMDHASIDMSLLDEEHQKLGEGLNYLLYCLKEQRDFARSLAKGNLSVQTPPASNELAAPLKALHASLKHLTWQTNQVAKGDYNQRVDFMGEFSDAFNTMIEQLDDRQRALEEEIAKTYLKTHELEQNNSLLEAITNEMSQWIIVVDLATDETLFENRAARGLSNKQNLKYELRNCFMPLGKKPVFYKKEAIMLNLQSNRESCYLSAVSYPVNWHDKSAIAYVITDVSDDMLHIKKLETYAYHDALTKVSNRFHGMQVLNEWLEEKKLFCLSIIDLDNLKYVNDRFGHTEGDFYIIDMVEALQTFKRGFLSRLGGDEFMLLMPDTDRTECEHMLAEIRNNLIEEDQKKIAKYFRSFSFGVVEVFEDNSFLSGDLLAVADKRMYEYKVAYKGLRGQPPKIS